MLCFLGFFVSFYGNAQASCGTGLLGGSVLARPEGLMGWDRGRHLSFHMCIDAQSDVGNLFPIRQNGPDGTPFPCAVYKADVGLSEQSLRSYTTPKRVPSVV